jgi:hypothetical protein
VSLSPVLLQDSYRTDPLPGLGACGRADRWCPGPGGGAGRGRPLQPGTPSHPQRPFRGSVRPGSGRTSPPPVSARFLREPPPVPRLTKAGRARPAVTCCQVLSKKVAASAAKAGVSPLLPPPTRYLLVGAELRGAAHGPAPPVSGSAPPLSREARDASGTAPSRQRGPPFPAAAPPGRAGGPRGSPGRGSRRPRGTAAGRGARRPPWSWGGARTEGVLSPGSFSLEGPRGREEGSDGVPSSLAGGSQPAWRLEGSAQ